MLQIEELHTQNNPGWVPFCIQWGIPVRHFPVYLRKESLSFSSAILSPSTELLQCLEGAATGRSVPATSGPRSKCGSAGENQLCLPSLLILSPGRIPSWTGLYRKLTNSLCLLQVLQVFGDGGMERKGAQKGTKAGTDFRSLESITCVIPQIPGLYMGPARRQLSCSSPPQ